MFECYNYKHFLLSKFNAPNAVKAIVLTKQRTDAYYKLFDKYCYPSVVNQTCNNFHWFIMFDENTTDKSWVESHELIHPIYVNDSSKPFKHRFKEAIKENLNQYEEHLITTRLDIDDTVHEDFIKNIQENKHLYSYEDSTNEDGVVLSFVDGLTHNIKSGVFKYWQKKYPNPFITLIEKIKDNKKLQTVLYTKHPQMHKYFNVFYLTNMATPMWIQNIGDWNVSNKMQGKNCKVDLTPYHITKESGC